MNDVALQMLLDSVHPWPCFSMDGHMLLGIIEFDCGPAGESATLPQHDQTTAHQNMLCTPPLSYMQGYRQRHTKAPCAIKGDTTIRETRITPLGYYLIAHGSWYASHGLQNVMFAWLVTMVLRESPTMVGLAQTAMLIPATLFMLVGGSFADRTGGKRVAFIAQSIAVLPPLALAFILFTGKLSFPIMVGYALAFGLVQAFVIPARDGMLNSVAESRVQRAVVKSIFVQFSMQLLGFALAGSAERIGGHWVILAQAMALGLGALAIRRIVVPIRRTVYRQSPVPLRQSIAEGYRGVIRSAAMRGVVIQNVAMGVFFMGTYIVTVPLIIREIYEGSSVDLAIVNTTNSVGLVMTILVLLRFGDIRRQGRALIIAHTTGSLALIGASLGLGFYAFAACMFLWGASGGIAITMSRTIMQEHAPDDLRGRVMGFHSFSFLGAGPIGALLWGFTIEKIGPEDSMMFAALGMLAVIAIVARGLGLWAVEPPKLVSSDVNRIASGDGGQSPLGDAFQNGNKAVIKALDSHGAKSVPYRN